MQEAILTNVIHFAPIGILALLLIMVLILVANLRQTKKINKKLTDTLQKADDYFQYIFCLFCESAHVTDFFFTDKAGIPLICPNTDCNLSNGVPEEREWHK